MALSSRTRQQFQIIFRADLLSLFYPYDARLYLRMHIQGFLRALITNLLSDLRILKWQIQYGR